MIDQVTRVSRFGQGHAQLWGDGENRENRSMGDPESVCDPMAGLADEFLRALSPG